jgi:peptide/nickel transport system substrate-binding protein/oligopeptide transport system substrate-binding protein
VSNTYPAVNYAELGKSEEAPVAQVRPQEGGVIQVPMKAALSHLDPTMTELLEEQEVLPSIYEALTIVREGRIEPLLASEFRIEDGSRKHIFRLRENVRFHDGRRLTARDVRFSFERLLQSRGIRSRQYEAIKGARDLIDGKGLELTGFHIHSANEFTIELENPVAFFPVLLSDTVCAILPEGTGSKIGNKTSEGAVGTGPYRIARFEPGVRLELERNPFYWREGYPRSQGLVFTFGAPSAEIMSGFRAGRFSVASDLSASDVEILRRDPTFAAGYREAPFLSTYFALFNRHSGPLADVSLRRRIIEGGDVAALVRQTMGRRAIPAHGWIPPGLLGHEPAIAGGSAPSQEASTGAPRSELELTAAVHPVFGGEYSRFYQGLEAIFRSAGIRIRPVTGSMSEFIDTWKNRKADMIIGRWLADYPDADTFVHCLSSNGGFAGIFCGSPEIDELNQRGRTEPDPGARHASYRQVEGIIRRDALLLPLFHEQVYRFARPVYEELRMKGA